MGGGDNRKRDAVRQGEGDTDMGQPWRAWRRPGEAERRWRGLGVEDAYGRRGEPEARCCSWGDGDTDMGQRWRAWRHPGERERRWRELGDGDVYQWRGEREVRCCSWGEGDIDLGQRWRARRRSEEQGCRWRGLGVESAYQWREEREARCCSSGEGDVDMGRREHSSVIMCHGQLMSVETFPLLQLHAWHGMLVQKVCKFRRENCRFVKLRANEDHM